MIFAVGVKSEISRVSDLCVDGVCCACKAGYLGHKGEGGRVPRRGDFASVHKNAYQFPRKVLVIIIQY